MKYILITTIALSLSLPIRAMEECDVQVLEKIKALNVQAQGIIAQTVDSSLKDADEPDQEITDFLAEALELQKKLEDESSK